MASPKFAKPRWTWRKRRKKAGNLENEGIKVVTFNKRDTSYNIFGYVELMVPEEDYDRAKQLIEETKTMDEDNF